ncbi:DNA-binding protein [archaeon]|nr:MAG: DNA-binding protein [archaeon]
MQLYLKYILSRKVGAFPKTYSLTELLREVAKALNAPDIEKFYHDNIEIINLLEDSYIVARYLPRVYDRHVAERTLEFAKKALEVLKCLEEQL